jgi:hypothetical protein
MGRIVVTATGIAFLLGLVLSLLFLLKLSFKGLPAKSDDAAKPEPVRSAPADVK